MAQALVYSLSGILGGDRGATHLQLPQDLPGTFQWVSRTVATPCSCRAPLGYAVPALESNMHPDLERPCRLVFSNTIC